MIGLRGAGILGLLVGGTGIANTMQVLLRRRQREIAVWKTLGYSAGDLRLIFSLEAGLLGLAGSLTGAALGALLSGQVLEMIRRISNVLYQWTFSPTPPLMGILIGTLTTILFASWAIVLSSQARPVALLRNEPVDVRQISGCLSVGLGLLLAVPFTVLTSLVMESVAGGIGVLVGILFGLAVLGGMFSLVLWACTRLLPLHGVPFLRIAIGSLRQRGFALVFAMIALFIGVLSMSAGLVVVEFGERRIGGPAAEPGNFNLNIIAAAGQEQAIAQALAAQNPEMMWVGYRTSLDNLRVVSYGSDSSDQPGDTTGANGPSRAMDAVLLGRSDPEDYIISGAAWGSQPDEVYAYSAAGLPAGSQVAVTLAGGETHTFTVVGTYDINYQGISLFPPAGLLISADGFNRVTRPDSVTFFARVAPDRLNQAAAALRADLPHATVVNLEDFAARFMISYRKLFVLPLVMSGLALLAGFLLVANAASLAMLERRYEIGVLKTVGYSRRQILSIFAVEYGLVGLLATVTGVLLIQGMLALLAGANRMPASLLMLSLPSMALIAFCGIGLTLLTALGVAWKPTCVLPVTVLNDGNA
jgi:putative ABC transport system permease protein